jgi:hypothetical protein
MTAPRAPLGDQTGPTVFDLPVSLTNWKRIVARLTRRIWNTIAATILLRAYEQGIITSSQLHILTREFDPTQAGTVSRL